MKLMLFVSKIKKKCFRFQYFQFYLIHIFFTAFDKRRILYDEKLFISFRSWNDWRNKTTNEFFFDQRKKWNEQRNGIHLIEILRTTKSIHRKFLFLFHIFSLSPIRFAQWNCRREFSRSLNSLLFFSIRLRQCFPNFFPLRHTKILIFFRDILKVLKKMNSVL